MKKKLIGLVILLGFCHLCLADPLSEQIETLRKQHIPHADIGIIVRDAQTGHVVYKYRADRAFSIASNAKMFTAAAALLYLGPDFIFPTTVEINPDNVDGGILQGNVYIKFTGDPTLTPKDLDALVAKIKTYGIQHINGDIVLDTSRYKGPVYPGDVRLDWINWYYVSPTTSIILNQNAVNLQIHPGIALGDEVTVTSNDPFFPTPEAHLKTVSWEEANNHCSINLKMDNKNRLRLKGCWPVEGGPSHLHVAIKNPVHFAKQVIQRALKTHNIGVSGIVIEGKPSHRHRIIAEHDSAPLSALIKIMLKESNNTFAETIAKSLGAEYTGIGSFLEGGNAIRAILNKHLPNPLEKTAFKDAAGIRDLVTPMQVADLLYLIYHQPVLKEYLIPGLPISGEDGTLVHRLRSVELAGHVVAKTGTMEDVSALSGYIVTDEEHHLIFSILINNVVGKVRHAETFQDSICTTISKYL